MPISVLIVEDHAELRSVVQTLLEQAGYAVHCAEDATQAIEILDTVGRPCLVLWDPLTLCVGGSSLVARAVSDGVHIATIPVGVTSIENVGPHAPRLVKRLTSTEAIMSIVREHCPLAPSIEPSAA